MLSLVGDSPLDAIPAQSSSFFSRYANFGEFKMSDYGKYLLTLPATGLYARQIAADGGAATGLL